MLIEGRVLIPDELTGYLARVVARQVQHDQAAGLAVPARVHDLIAELWAVDAAITARSPVIAPLTETLTVAEAARMFGQSEVTVRRWCRAGRLPARKDQTRWLVSLPTRSSAPSATSS